MNPQPRPDRDDSPPAPREPYEPPTAEDVETTHSPAETVPGAGSGL